MRVVVVGATGNVGTSVVEALAADPQISSMAALARRTPDAAHRLAEGRAAEVDWKSADIAASDLAGHFRGADAVVHLAWLFQPTHKPEVTWRINAIGSARVFQAVADAGVRTLVYASSVGAYSPGPKDDAVDESWPTHGWPSAGYTREKAYVERLLDSFEREHPQVRVVRLRPGFIFMRGSASQQRRLFAGPLVPGSLVRPGLVPLLPDIPQLRFQAMHSDDAGEAYRLAVVSDVRGAFNLAAEPVIDSARLAELLGARTFRLPAGLARAAVAAAWHLHVLPASPALFDAVLRLPIMDTTRARRELGWTPRVSATAALRGFLEGLRAGAGLPTPPLEGKAGGPARLREIGTGVGERP